LSDTKAGENKSAPPAGLQSRQTAMRLLGAVIDKKTPVDALTDNEHGHPHYLMLASRDRALVRAILGVAFRHRGDIEAALKHFLDRPLPGGAKALKHLLHVAAAQILYLDVPDHAAIYLAVAAAKKNPQLKRFAGLINAILRRLSKEAGTIRKMQDPFINAPRWFNHMLLETYGKEKAEAILAVQQYEPPLDITVKTDPQMWTARLGGRILPNGTVRLTGFEAPLTELPGFAEGAWWVQDVAASLPARLMGAIKGQRVADLCSAPGGKTAQLVLAGAHVTAVDLSENRLKRLKYNMARLGFDVKTWAGDLRKITPDQLFDAVLLDAPCSSTGTIRRHPDVLWIKDENDIHKLASLQAELLNHAIDLTRRGGTIMFSNCSLAPDEGEKLVGKLLDTRKDIMLMPVLPQEIPGLEQLITPEGFLRTTPADLPDDNPRLSGMDGFFAARLKRL